MIADDIAAVPAQRATGKRCTCCAAMAALPDDQRDELLAIIRGEILHPHRNRTFTDSEVGAWLGLGEYVVRDCRLRHLRIRRYAR